VNNISFLTFKAKEFKLLDDEVGSKIIGFIMKKYREILPSNLIMTLKVLQENTLTKHLLKSEDIQWSALENHLLVHFRANPKD
jgi:hypothetical protein